jgi:hypothetical protein
MPLFTWDCSIQMCKHEKNRYIQKQNILPCLQLIGTLYAHCIIPICQLSIKLKISVAWLLHPLTNLTSCHMERLQHERSRDYLHIYLQVHLSLKDKGWPFIHLVSMFVFRGFERSVEVAFRGVIVEKTWWPCHFFHQKQNDDTCQQWT